MSFKTDAIKIKRWREERHWSQEHLAALAGIGLRTVQRMENGEQASPESLKALAAAFNVDVAALSIDPEIEAARIVRSQNAKGRAGVQLSFLIHFASYLLGVLVFVAIGLNSVTGLFTMKIPLIWWTVGLASHGLTVFIVEVATRYKDRFTDT